MTQRDPNFLIRSLRRTNTDTTAHAAARERVKQTWEAYEATRGQSDAERQHAYDVHVQAQVEFNRSCLMVGAL